MQFVSFYTDWSVS